MGLQLIVYSRRTGRVRRVIDDDRYPIERVVSLYQVHDGEATTIYPKLGENDADLDAWQAFVTEQTGLAPVHDRYVVVDRTTHAIVGVLESADPACGDAVEGCDLVQHDEADASWQWDGAAYSRSYTDEELDAMAAKAAAAGAG